MHKIQIELFSWNLWMIKGVAIENSSSEHLGWKTEIRKARVLSQPAVNGTKIYTVVVGKFLPRIQPTSSQKTARFTFSLLCFALCCGKLSEQMSETRKNSTDSTDDYQPRTRYVSFNYNRFLCTPLTSTISVWDSFEIEITHFIESILR